MNEESQSIEREAQLRQIKERVDEVRERVEAAARRSGRTGGDVLLVGVSKYATPDDGVVEGLLKAGVCDLAENRPQRLLEKVEVWGKSEYWRQPASQTFVSPSDKAVSIDAGTLRWHFIGSLQRNKVRRVLPHIALLHSVDSWKLLEAINRILEEEETASAQAANGSLTPAFPHTLSALLEAHISDDETKQGFSLEEIVDVVPKLAQFPHIKPCGLMGMGGLTASPDEVRRQFASLRETLERCRKLCPELTDFKELSMGMSGDFETAIEEGATIVRVGSILYPQK